MAALPRAFHENALALGLSWSCSLPAARACARSGGHEGGELALLLGGHLLQRLVERLLHSDGEHHNFLLLHVDGFRTAQMKRPRTVL